MTPDQRVYMARYIARRKFLATLGGAATWPLAARAQQGEGMRRICALMNLAADDPEALGRITAFVQGLQQLGWTDGRNVRAAGVPSAGSALATIYSSLSNLQAGTTSPNSRSPLAHWETSAPAPREPGPKPNSISSSLSYRDLALQPVRRCCEPVVKRVQSTRMPRTTMREKFSGPD